MVAGKDAEAAGVLREYLGDAEFGGEIGDALGRVVAQALVPARLAEVTVQVRRGFLHARHELSVRGQVLKLFPADGPKQGNGIMLRVFPQRRVEPCKKFPRGPVP